METSISYLPNIQIKIPKSKKTRMTKYSNINTNWIPIQKNETLFNNQPGADCLVKSCNFVQIENLNNVSLESSLYLIQEIIKQCQEKQQKMLSALQANSLALFCAKEYFVNHQNKLVVIPHQIYNCCQVRNDEELAVTKIIKMVGKISNRKSFQDFQKYYLRVSVKEKCDFKYTLLMIQTYSQCSKTTIQNKVLFCNQDLNGSKRKICELISSERLSQISYIKNSLKRTTRLVKSSYNSQQKSSRSSNTSPIRSLNFGSNLMSPCSEKAFKIRQSTASTANRTSSGNDSVGGSRTSIGNQLGLSSIRDPYKIKINKNLFPTSLQQIQSQNEETSKGQESHLTVRNTGTTNQNQQKIILKREWQPKVSRLCKQSNMKQSYTIQSQGSLESIQNNANCNSQQIVLGKFARAIVRSIMPVQNQ